MLDYTPIRNNYVKLSLTAEELQDMAKHAEFYSGTDLNAYRGKLSRAEWLALRDEFVNLGENTVVDPEAEIIYNSYDHYTVWLRFIGKDGAWKQFELMIPKAKDSNGIETARMVDERCMKTGLIYNKLRAGQLTKEEMTELLDIVTATGAKYLDSKILRIQYKINGYIVEKAVERAAKDLGLTCIELDPYGDLFYKGTPGNLSDFKIYFDNTPVKVEVKLIQKGITEAVRNAAHNAQVLVCYSLSKKQFIAEQFSNCPIDLLNNPEFIALLQKATINLRNIADNTGGPFISLTEFNPDTGKISFNLFH